jgi:hypothetical protein
VYGGGERCASSLRPCARRPWGCHRNSPGPRLNGPRPTALSATSSDSVVSLESATSRYSWLYTDITPVDILFIVCLFKFRFKCDSISLLIHPSFFTVLLVCQNRMSLRMSGFKTRMSGPALMIHFNVHRKECNICVRVIYRVFIKKLLRTHFIQKCFLENNPAK